MKKIDLHTHTLCTASDSQFVFSIDAIRGYVSNCKIDALAITNHNVFDLNQYQAITDSVSCLVLPGIEIDLEGGHILVISDPENVNDFTARCGQVSQKITSQNSFIGISDFKGIFPDLSRYLLIPHYDKKPSIANQHIKSLGDSIKAGEVSSPKKFIYCKKDSKSLIPVYFSDFRFGENVVDFPIRQTFVDIGDVTFSSLCYALSDRDKVFLTDQKGRGYFQATSDGLILSTGLNVIIGERSSGKSFTLDKLKENFERVKYIRQFSLVEKSDEKEFEKYNDLLHQKESLFVEDFLKEFKQAVDEVVGIDLKEDERCLESYITSLLQHAREYEKADAFSKAQLFSETEFPSESFENIKKLIDATILLLENTEYREIIRRFVSEENLKALAVELILKYQEAKENRLKKIWVNDLIVSIRGELKRRTAATPISDVDLYEIAMNRKKISKFKELVNVLKKEREIYRQEVQSYRIVALIKIFSGAGQMKKLSGRQLTFSNAFDFYSDPYDFLIKLKEIDGLASTEYYKYFCNIEYKILNRFDFEVSGGERSEFRLLQEISDAMQYDLLLVDEPESSFDNIFLNKEVNLLLKSIAQQMPVVIVTHNSTIGASIKPDFVVHTQRLVGPSGVKYLAYYGHPSDRILKTADGQELQNYQALLDCLEAGLDAYHERGKIYETLKN
jgi:hypothetical protein